MDFQNQFCQLSCLDKDLKWISICKGVLEKPENKGTIKLKINVYNNTSILNKTDIDFSTYQFPQPTRSFFVSPKNNSTEENNHNFQITHTTIQHNSSQNEKEKQKQKQKEKEKKSSLQKQENKDKLKKEKTISLKIVKKDRFCVFQKNLLHLHSPNSTEYVISFVSNEYCFVIGSIVHNTTIGKMRKLPQLSKNNLGTINKLLYYSDTKKKNMFLKQILKKVTFLFLQIFIFLN
ncbi:hypothetical protein M0813_12970 [Anaeramoeba flamelloides]|uniref:Uncharacterized protein n=1 Tax=Anaeramoeba flamelloides TaxID=1746091 RepID=A0ABQ8ZA00_9EUKA|nr:hypothetical protein M0813_12970 [Anaeramoeba flamelloides]